jgi:hypothetical protein
MAGLVVPFYLAIGCGLAVAGHSVSPLEVFLAVAVMGALTAIPVGYTYVGIVMVLRRALGQRLQSIPQH